MIPTIPGYHGDDPTDARLAVFPMFGPWRELPPAPELSSSREGRHSGPQAPNRRWRVGAADFSAGEKDGKPPALASRRDRTGWTWRRGRSARPQRSRASSRAWSRAASRGECEWPARPFESWIRCWGLGRRASGPLLLETRGGLSRPPSIAFAGETGAISALSVGMELL